LEKDGLVRNVDNWIVGLMLIICALVLLAGSLYLIPAMGKYLEKLAKFLGGFQLVIGIVAIVVAVLSMLDDIGIGNIVLLIVGLMLAASIMTALPAVGKYIAKLTKWLGASQTLIGVIALIVGIWVLL